MRIVLLSLLLLTGLASDASGRARPPRPAAVIRYRADGHLILLPVRIGDRNEWFVFDSGAPHLVLDPRLSGPLRLRARSEGATTGTGSGAVPLTHLDPVTVRLGSVAIRAEDPWAIDLSKVPIATDVRGLVGADLWSRWVVRIDPRTQTLALFDPARFRPGRGDRVVPLIVEGQKLFLQAKLDVRPGLSVTHKLRIDTGAEETVNDPILAQAAETRRSTVGNGLGQSFVALSGKIDAVHVGPFTIRQVWGPGGPGPAIGMEIFRRFVTTFDAPHGRLYLTPTAELGEPVPPPPGS